MHAKPIVTRLFSAVQPRMHAARERALTDVVLSAVNGNALSLCALALGTARATALRHRVKCVDRLLSNDHLHQERVALYGALAQWLTGLPQLLIVVDWSSLSADMQWHWLRASVVVQGRSLTLYEEVHPRHHLANLAVHRRFLSITSLRAATSVSRLIARQETSGKDQVFETNSVWSRHGGNCEMGALEIAAFALRSDGSVDVRKEGL